MANDKSRPRLVVELSDADDAKLDLAASTTGTTKTAIARAALAFYFKACVEVAKGGEVLIKKGDGSVVELMFPTT